MTQQQVDRPTQLDRSRREVLRGVAALGAAGLAGAALSSCAGGDGKADAGGSRGDSAAGDSTAGGTEKTASVSAKTAEVPEGGGKVLDAQKVVVTQPEAGKFKAFSAVCTHQGCIVADVDAGTINCACHGSKFSIADGSVQAGPATRPLPRKQVTVEGDEVRIS